MNDLIKVDSNSDRPTVSGRGHHEFLEVATPYDKWFPHMLTHNGCNAEVIHDPHNDGNLYGEGNPSTCTGRSCIYTS